MGLHGPVEESLVLSRPLESPNLAAITEKFGAAENPPKKFDQPKIREDKNIRPPPNFFLADFRRQRKSQYACK